MAGAKRKPCAHYRQPDREAVGLAELRVSCAPACDSGPGDMRNDGRRHGCMREACAGRGVCPALAERNATAAGRRWWRAACRPAVAGLDDCGR